jgi:hypothetical protein
MPNGIKEVISLSDCVEQVAKFSGTSLAAKISELEFKFSGVEKSQFADQLRAISVNPNLLEAARAVKRAAAQIDVVMHALGILLLLPSILDDGEVVESLSLGAGSTDTKRFDLETDRRVAEFTFIDWRGNDSTRLQKIFKDFYRIAEFNTSKAKELWLTDDSYVLKYLRGGASIRSATHKHRDVWESFRSKYPDIERVGDYYRLHAGNVFLKVYGRSTNDGKN